MNVLSLPEFARSLRTWIFGAALVIGVGFHYLLSHVVYGWPFALFALLVTAGTILLAHKGRGVRNRWALAFLAPLVSACISTSVYSSDAVKAMAFFTVILSLAALAYWLTAPVVAWRDGVHVWNTGVVLESALPFRQYQALFTEGSVRRKVDAKTLMQVAVGLLVAVPVLMVFFTLFMEGDRFFQQTFQQWINFDFLTDDIVRLIFDVIITIFASAFFWNVVRRSRDESHTKDKKYLFEEIIATRAFLFAIASLFVLFAGFQIFYLFQGSEYILAQGKTYAEYAVSGYQQLCFAALLAFLILFVVYRLTEMKDAPIKLVSLIIAVTSVISTISAGKRLWLYVDAYGLTLSRWWGAQFLVVVIILFGVLCVSIVRHWNAAQLTIAGTGIFMGILSLTLLLNHEGFVANYNLSRHMERKGPALDINYLIHSLGADAVPTIASYIVRPDWRENSNTSASSSRQSIYRAWQEDRDIYYTLHYLRPDTDPRFLTFSDIRARNIIKMLTGS